VGTSCGLGWEQLCSVQCVPAVDGRGVFYGHPWEHPLRNSEKSWSDWEFGIMTTTPSSVKSEISDSQTPGLFTDFGQVGVSSPLESFGQNPWWCSQRQRHRYSGARRVPRGSHVPSRCGLNEGLVTVHCRHPGSHSSSPSVSTQPTPVRLSDGVSELTLG